ncbi:hypothetical protein JOQ06_004033 [Pogonophryne albipinna]|uniref:Uncharacterized protein n=1 Tax=Pogonophryne albipinna TaxID=1090488 RepID=A0AAD6ABX5_9TELE|nr:hypothetical protein JOQ06_004033 [Pogonophryne albipinna]
MLDKMNQKMWSLEEVFVEGSGPQPERLPKGPPARPSFSGTASTIDSGALVWEAAETADSVACELYDDDEARPTRQQDLDEALVNLIVKDTQPFSVVEDVGFRAFVALLDPNYVIPTRQAVKAMVDVKYVLERNKAIADMQKIAAECNNFPKHTLLKTWPE